LKTSYFAKRNIPKDQKTISIALYSPKWYEGKTYKLLHPPKYLISMGVNDIYKKSYYKDVLDKLDANKVYAALKDYILLCYEKDRNTCHRSIVAEWIEKETGHIVDEWRPPDVQTELF